MLLVIFGAGATYDSDPATPPTTRTLDRPPLAAELFDGRQLFRGYLSTFSECGPVVQRIRRDLGGTDGRSVEALLRAIEQDAEDYDPAKVQLAALRFYLQAIISDISSRWLEQCSRMTNYQLLLDHIRRWQHKTQQDVSVVTFNYDLLLEEAVLDIYQRSFVTIDSYVERGELRIFKPHGSINWCHKVPDWHYEDRFNFGTDVNVDRKRLALDAPSLDISGDFVLRDYETTKPVDRNAEGSTAYFPALAIPVEAKAEWECPGSHKAQLAATLKDVDNFLIVGWKGAEQNFVSFLQEHIRPGGRVSIVCESDDAASTTWRNMQALTKIDHYCPIGDGFTGFMRDERAVGEVLDKQAYYIQSSHQPRPVWAE